MPGVADIAGIVGALGRPADLAGARSCSPLLRRAAEAPFDFVFAFVVPFVDIVRDFRKPFGFV